MADKTSVIKLKVSAIVDGKKQVGEMSVSLNELEQATKRARASMSAVTFANIAQGAEAASSAINSMMGVLNNLSQAYAAQEEVERKLETVMRERMDATDSEIQKIKDLASAQQELGIIGDEVQLAGAQQIATFIEQRQSLETLIPAMNNLLAQQKGYNATAGDAVNIANLIGKAMQGQVGALKRVGITFDEAQAMVMKYGSESERAAMLAQIITQNVGEMNARLAQTSSGKIKQLENALGDVNEQLGGLVQGVMPLLTLAANATTALTGVIKLTAGIKSAVAAMRAWNVSGKIAAALGLTIGSNSAAGAVGVRGLAGAMRGASISAQGLKVAIRGLLISTGVGAAIVALTVAIEALMHVMGKAKEKEQQLREEEERHKDALRDFERQARQTAAQEMIDLDKLYYKAKDEAKSRRERIAAIKEMQAMYPQYFSNVDAESLNITQLSQAYDRLKSDIMAATRARAAFERLTAVQSDILEVEEQIANAGTQQGQSSQSVPIPDWARLFGTVATNAIAPGIGYYNDALLSLYQQATSDPDTDPEVLQARLRRLQEQAAYYEQIIQESPEMPQQSPTYTPRTGGGGARSGGGGSSAASTERPATLNGNAETLREIEGNITFLRERLQDAGVDEAAIINRSIKYWEERAQAIREAGKEVEQALPDLTPVVTKDATTLAQYTRNIEILQNQLQTASIEQAAEINQEIQAWQRKADAIRNAGKEYNENAATLEEITQNIDILRERMQQASVEEAAEINRLIRLWEKKAETIRDAGNAPVFDAQASTLRGISQNIDILNEKLQTASLAEATALNQQIQLWEKKADAIRNAGKLAEVTFETYKNGWSGIKGVYSGIKGINDAWKGNGTILDKVMTSIDGIISAYEGIMSVVKIVNLLTAAHEMSAAATMTDATAKQVNAAASTEETAASVGQTAAALAAALAAKTEATANLTAAAAKSFNAHSWIPFVGIGMAAASVITMIAMMSKLPKFADGGIAYGPTLGLFGEYSGARSNPEVVAPLDKLRDMIGTGTMPAEVELKARGENLYAVLRTYERRISR